MLAVSFDAQNADLSMLQGPHARLACKIVHPRRKRSVGKRLGFDDALDVWGVHGMGGFMGTVLQPDRNHKRWHIPVRASC